ncbi:hypothetical protein TELCIR_00196 [Teladorsagia circumcincta]|uniref:Peptidase S1 domain-containing protein n=1 Tax=Teladorsagia circumcincta TaxID=45464 RepID=A0A2G9V5D5_TELCI|nr:hypothetical protein TELCIR_00196 [Teladorsagia circumcincta]
MPAPRNYGNYIHSLQGDSGVGLYHVKEAQATVFGLLSAGKNCTKVQKEGHSEDTFVPVTNMLWWIRSILGDFLLLRSLPPFGGYCKTKGENGGFDGKVTDETIHFAYDAKKELYRRQEPMYYK